MASDEVVEGMILPVFSPLTIGTGFDHNLLLLSEVIRSNEEVIAGKLDPDFTIFVVIVITALETQVLQSSGNLGAEEDFGVGFIGGDIILEDCLCVCAWHFLFLGDFFSLMRKFLRVDHF